MKRLVVLLGAVWCMWSCGGDDGTPVGQYAEQCDESTKCADGLICSFNLCTTRCSSNQECQALNSAAACVGGTCFNTCVDTFNCPNGLVCQMVASTNGTCRAR